MKTLTEGLPHAPLDIIAVIVILALLFGFFMYVRKTLALSFLLSVYLAAFLYSVFPYKNSLAFLVQTPLFAEFLPIGVFLLLFLFCLFCIRPALSAVYSANPLLKSLESALLAFLSAGSLFLILSNVVLWQRISTLAPSLSGIFSIPGILFWWGVGSISALLFIARD